MNKLHAGLLALLISMIGFAEGLRLFAYRDPVGIPTLCYGETHGVRMGDRATRAQCNEMLRNRIVLTHARIAPCFTRAVPPGLLVASIDIAYNAGPAALCKSTLMRKANAGDFTGACNELPRWVYADGKRLPGLVARRSAFKSICLGGIPDAPASLAQSH